MAKILRRLRINEVSSVTRGAGEGVKIMLMKAAVPLYTSLAKDDDLDDAALEYIKREFSQEQRDRAASSGAALPDGSFPIHNKSDLHNAMRAIGRAKDPAKAKAHIRRRAKALGLTGELSDAFKGDVSSRIADYFAGLFKRKDEAALADQFDDALAGLAESVKSIVDDDSDADKEDLLAKTFTQFHQHITPLLGDRASPRQPADKGDDIMSAQLLKALGLKDDASEEDALKAIAELAKAAAAKARRNGNGNGNGDGDDEEEDDDDEEEKKKLAALPASVRKMIEDGQDAIKRVKKLEDEAALAGFAKQCAEIGLPDSHAATLQKAYSGDKAAVDELLKLTKSGFAAAKAAGVFKEFGASGGTGGGTAFEQFTALAAKYLKEHASEGLTHEQAFSKVYQAPENKDLRLLEAKESGRA